MADPDFELNEGPADLKNNLFFIFSGPQGFEFVLKTRCGGDPPRPLP